MQGPLMKILKLFIYTFHVISRLIPLCFGIFLFCIWAPSAAAEDAFSGTTLKGPYLFKTGDDPTWAGHDLDDSDWSRINVPGIWQTQGIEFSYLAWYRIKFTLPAHYDLEKLGVYLGQISNADETFLNGVKIGTTGKLGKRFVDAKRVRRLYKIPPGVLQKDGINLLAIRVMSVEPGSGLVSDKPVIGEYMSLLSAKQNKDIYRIAQETVFITILSIFSISSLFFYITGTREKEFIYFCCLTFVIAFNILVEGVLFFEAGFRTPVIYSVSLMLSSLMPVFLMLFYISFCKFPEKRFITYATRYFFCFSIVLLCFDNYNYISHAVLTVIWIAQGPVITAIMFYMIYYMVSRKVPEYLPVFLGSIVFIITFPLIGISSLNTEVFSISWVYLLEYYSHIFTVFMMTLIYALGMRFSRIRKRAISLSGKMLNAQEEERTRLAKQLQESLGQSMLAIKINLRRINKKIQERSFTEVLSKVSASIKELAGISMGLRPALLDKAELGTVIKNYLTQITENSDVQIDVISDKIPRLSPMVEDNMFRIFQEAISNALKHSLAKHIHIRLHHENGVLRMEIEDDGIGFDYPKAISASKGLGLSTFKERMDLIKGKIQIRSQKNHGTLIHVQVKAKSL